MFSAEHTLHGLRVERVCAQCIERIRREGYQPPLTQSLGRSLYQVFRQPLSRGWDYSPDIPVPSLTEYSMGANLGRVDELVPCPSISYPL